MKSFKEFSNSLKKVVGLSLFLAVVIKPFSLWADSDYPLDATPDHAPLVEGHVHSADDYISRMLKVDGAYNEAKIAEFLERLKKEKQSLLEDTYETALIENLELKIDDFESAKKDASKELEEKKNALVQGYVKFLIPQIEVLLKKVQEKKSTDECDAIVDAFNIIYSSYYMPEIDRNMWNMDRKPWLNLKEAFTGYTFYKDDVLQDPRPNNLAITAEQKEEAEKCVNHELPVKRALSDQDVVSLVKCGFDISRLDPVKSPLWRDYSHDQKGFDSTKDLKVSEYPGPEDKIYFQEVKYSSAGSRKMNVYFQRGKKKIKLKLKMGQEVHNEIATTYLMQMMGFHQDHVVYRPTVKVYFAEGDSFETFKRAWRRRYGSYENFVMERGEENGEQYVIFRDALFELKAENKIRLEAYHPDGWDLPNRRENRGLFTVYAWLNMGDLKPGNHIVNLTKNKDGIYIPELSLQDVGYSLRSNLSYNPKYLINNLRYEFSSRNVNAFETDILNWDQSKVKFYWNDISFHSKRWATTTYNDLKWMARKMAKLSLEDIRFALSVSGMPKDVQDLYAIKLAMRRNQIVQAFDLEREFPLMVVPDLDSYSPNENIKNGKITKPQLDNSSRYEDPEASIWPKIIELVSHTFDFQALGQKFFAKIGGGSLGGGVDVPATLWDGKQGQNISFSALMGGVRVGIDRKVGFNHEFIANNGDATAYAVVDTLRIELYLSSGLLGDISKFLPVSLRADLSVYAKEFQMVQYASDWKKGYLKPFRLFNVLKNYKNYVAEKLEPQEVVKMEDSYGMKVSVGLGTPAPVALMTTGIGVGVNWRRSAPVYFFRDGFGQLQVYEAKNQTFDTGVNFNVATIDLYLIALPIVTYGGGVTHFHHQGELYTFDLPYYSKIGGVSVLTKQRREQERVAFEHFVENGYRDVDVLIHRNMNLDAVGKMEYRRSTFLGLIHSGRNLGRVKSVVRLPNKEPRTFHRAFYLSDSTFGYIPNIHELINSFFAGIMIIEKDLTSVDVELDEKDYENSVAIVNIHSFDRKLDKKGLIQKIEKINQTYSENKETPVYRGYVLPDESEINQYRKVNSQMRIYINGAAFWNEFLKLSEDDLRERIKPFIEKTKMPFSPRAREDKILLLDRIKKEYKRIAGKLARYQDDLRDHKNDPQAEVATMVDIIRTLQPETYGVNLLRAVLGAKNFFVMGEIFGVFPSFNYLQTFESVVGRRFAAKSWGEFQPNPPIRRFMARNEVAPINNYVSMGIDQQMIFGNFPIVTPSVYW